MHNLMTFYLDKLIHTKVGCSIYVLLNAVIFVTLAIGVGYGRRWEEVPLLLAQAVNTWYSVNTLLEVFDL